MPQLSLTGAEALRVRLASLLLAPGLAPRRRPTDVAGVVEWFGAMQAQENPSAMWSLGCRLPDMTTTDVSEALERREALRTWPMRGTVHLVPPRDAQWMLEVTGVRALAGAARRREILGLPERSAEQAVDVLGEALAGGGRLTRAECVAALTAAGVAAEGNWAYHLLWYASQRGVLCIAPHVGKEQTFVRLDEWVPDPRRPSREEALAILATRYFRSHGPTTRQDFAGWTGLTATDAKLGIAGAGQALTEVDVDGRQMYADPEFLDAPLGDPSTDDVLALPGFDEYLLGYKDRTLMLDPGHKDAVIPGGNGIFQWTIVRAGRVVGTWRRKVTSTRIVVDVLPLVPLGDRRLVEQAVSGFARFARSPVEVRFGETLVSSRSLGHREDRA